MHCRRQLLRRRRGWIPGDRLSAAETTGDDCNGVFAIVLAGSMVEEGDDNATEIVITGNDETGGNGGDGLLLVRKAALIATA